MDGRMDDGVAWMTGQQGGWMGGGSAGLPPESSGRLRNLDRVLQLTPLLLHLLLVKS